MATEKDFFDTCNFISLDKLEMLNSLRANVKTQDKLREYMEELNNLDDSWLEIFHTCISTCPTYDPLASIMNENESIETIETISDSIDLSAHNSRIPEVYELSENINPQSSTTFQMSTIMIDDENSSISPLSLSASIPPSVLASQPSDFERLYRLGAGGFGTVYKARQKSTNVEFAIKIVSCSKPTIGELHFLQTCCHPNIINYHSHFKVDSSLWIVMEYASGGSVDDYITSRNGQISESSITYILYELLKGLHYLHSNDIIHRDVKPGNLLITRDGSVKLADLGCSKQLNFHQDMTSTLVGTPEFMGPEFWNDFKGKQFKRQSLFYGKKSDVWAVGVTALHLCGVDMDGAENLKNCNWSEGLCEFVERCLERNENDRPEVGVLVKDVIFTNNGSEGKEEVKKFAEEREREIASKKERLELPLFAIFGKKEEETKAEAFGPRKSGEVLLENSLNVMEKIQKEIIKIFGNKCETFAEFFPYFEEFYRELMLLKKEKYIIAVYGEPLAQDFMDKTKSFDFIYLGNFEEQNTNEESLSDLETDNMSEDGFFVIKMNELGYFRKLLASDTKFAGLILNKQPTETMSVATIKTVLEDKQYGIDFPVWDFKTTSNSRQEGGISEFKKWAKQKLFRNKGLLSPEKRKKFIGFWAKLFQNLVVKICEKQQSIVDYENNIKLVFVLFDLFLVAIPFVYCLVSDKMDVFEPFWNLIWRPHWTFWDDKHLGKLNIKKGVIWQTNRTKDLDTILVKMTEVTFEYFEAINQPGADANIKTINDRWCAFLWG